MSCYLYLCEDIDDTARASSIRQQYLGAHLRYVQEHIDRYAVAGPNRHVDGEYHSSTFIVKADSVAQADAIMAADPYVAAGLYRALTGLEFVPAAGEWVGGTLWQKD